jgi:hypothetical protein
VPKGTLICGCSIGFYKHFVPKGTRVSAVAVFSINILCLKAQIFIPSGIQC